MPKRTNYILNEITKLIAGDEPDEQVLDEIHHMVTPLTAGQPAPAVSVESRVTGIANSSIKLDRSDQWQYGVRWALSEVEREFTAAPATTEPVRYKPHVSSDADGLLVELRLSPSERMAFEVDWEGTLSEIVYVEDGKIFSEPAATEVPDTEPVMCKCGHDDYSHVGRVMCRYSTCPCGRFQPATQQARGAE